MDDAPPAPSRRLLRIPLLSIAPAALLPAWWEPAYSAMALAGLALLGLAAVVAARSRATDPWRRVARASVSRGGAMAHAGAGPRAAPRAPELRAPSPEPAPEAAAAHVARFAAPRLPLVPTPGLSPVALHLVTGADRDAIARGVVETAAQLLARGDSVLVVDAGGRLELHAAFGSEPHWGVAECLQGRLPLLGVVQSTGRNGLFLLARGHAEPDSPWRAFGRLLDDATAQFARVVVALDADCPPEVAPAFGPRELEGWWAGDGGRPRGAQAFTERVGIPLLGLAVQGSLQTLLEGLSRTSRARHVPGRPAAAGARQPRSRLADHVAAAPTVAPDRQPCPASAIALLPISGPDAAASASVAGTPSRLREADEPISPLVLPCDARVTERLRFLAWARGLRDQRPAGTAADDTPHLVGVS